MEFIDRKKEINRLTRALRSEKKRFIVMYGRRRLGKSTLNIFLPISVDEVRSLRVMVQGLL